MRRLVLSTTPTVGQPYALDATSSHYVTNVLRMAAGDLVEAIDGHGRLYRAELAWFHGAAHLVAIEVIAEAEVQPDCVVVAALIKQHRWEWLLEKCCELGATHIVPLQAERSMVRVEERADAKIERWQRICDETAKQCERLDPPRVEAPATLEKALAARSSHRWLEFDESQRLGEWSTLDVTGPLVIVVGPEGGLTEREKQRIRSAGATTLGLGRHLLRAETAVTAALAAIRLRRDGLL